MDDEVDAELLLAAVRGVRRGVRRISGAPGLREGLTGSQVELLRTVRYQPGITVGQAAQALAVAGNTVSTLVRRLVDLGHLVRESDPGDARTARLYLTAETAATLRDWRDRRHTAVAAALAGMAPGLRAQVEGAVAVLTAVADALEEQQ